MAKTPSLFDPIQVGDLHLPNRIFMAPLSALRGTSDHIPTPIMVDYYTQRASAGLIISEGTPVDPLGVGYANVPGIWSKQQVEAWKPVTAAIHKAGGHIFAQIWHVGRISDPEFLNGQLPVAPSAIAASGTVSLLRPQRPFVTPRALELSEVKGVVEAFRRGAQNAQAAGFRRGRAPRSQRLPARSVPPGRDQPPHRRVRRPHRKSCATHARVRRCRNLRLWPGTRRNAPRTPPARRTTSRTPTGKPPSPTLPANWESANSPSSPPVNTSDRTAWVLRSSRPSAASSSPTKPSTSRSASSFWTRVKPTPWPSASSSSPTPTSPPASRRKPNSTARNAATFYASGAEGYIDYPPLQG